MRSRAAVLHGTHQEWQIEEIEVDAPKAGEVIVERKAASLCHSHSHSHSHSHEGAGVIAEVGPGISGLAVGDHVSASLVPSKEIRGTIFGSLTPRTDIPRLLDLCRDGQLELDELIANRYTLDEINDGYQAMRDGTNIRGVVVHG